MKLRALRTLKRAAKSAFIFVLEMGAPLHRALTGQSNPAGSGRRQRVAVVCWRKQIRRLQHTDPPWWTGRGSCPGEIESMRERKFGRIINISSINGQKGQFGQTNYSAAKAAEIGSPRRWRRNARASASPS